MPVLQDTVKPTDPSRLRAKIGATKKTEELSLCRAVMEHLEIYGAVIFKITRSGETLSVDIVVSKCCVFLLGGSFKVGEREYDKLGEGYIIEDETQVNLVEKSAIVMINM